MTRRNPRSECGFTLVELLIAMSLGLIVATAAMAIVIGALHFSSNDQDRIDANQQGRNAMTRIVQALDSSCVSAATAPILASSTATSISFYSNLADSSSINPNLVTVSLTGGSLVMSTATWRTGTGPSTWTFNTATNFTLIKHAAQTVSGGTTAPLFKYFGYGSAGVMSTTAYAMPLSSSNAATTSMVTISFQALPSDGWSAGNRGADFQNSVVLRLTPASGASSASNLPCSPS